MPARHTAPPRPHFFTPELPACVAWQPRRRWPLGVSAQSAALRHLAELLAEREHVWRDDDPESVHRIRVATRRLRSTLQTFAALWPAEDAARWVLELGRFARAFDEARDLDVRLAEVAAHDDAPSAPDTDVDTARLHEHERSQARAWLAKRWRRRRQDLTDDLRRALVRFEQAWAPQRLMEFLSTSPLDLWTWSVEHADQAERVELPAKADRSALGAVARADATNPPPGKTSAPADTERTERTERDGSDAHGAGQHRAAGRDDDHDDHDDHDHDHDAVTGRAEAGERRPPRPPVWRTPRG